MREANLAQGRGGDAGPSEKALRRSLEKARKQGRDELLREDIAMRKALDALVENAKPITVEQAEARGKLWTPDKEEPRAKAALRRELWTPQAPCDLRRMAQPKSRSGRPKPIARLRLSAAATGSSLSSATRLKDSNRPSEMKREQ